MRRVGLIGLLLSSSLAACTDANPHDRPTTAVAPIPTLRVTSSTPAPVETTSVAMRPSRPTLPADVPTTGPNTHPGERPPLEPILATQHSRAGAIAFAKFFIRTIDWAYATTSATYMRHYFEATCVICVGLAREIDADRRRGRHIVGDRVTIRSVSWRSRADVVVRTDVTSAEVVDRDGYSTNGAPAYTDFAEHIHPQWQDGWRVIEMRGQQ